MFCKVSILGNDSDEPWEIVTVGGIEFEHSQPNFLLARLASATTDMNRLAAKVESALPSLAAIVLFRRLVALKFHVDRGPGYADIILRDPRHFTGLESFSDRMQDIPRVRDDIIIHELAKNGSDRAEVLMADATLLHALEDFIRAVLYPDTTLASLYKSIEIIQKRLGGRTNFSQIGLSKAFVDYVMERGNREVADERHAPDNPISIEPIDLKEKRVCLERTRDVIVKYAASI